MGVYADHFIGYVLDVTEQYGKIQRLGDRDSFDKRWIEGEPIEISQNCVFKPYYSKGKLKENEITLLYDGMDGEYTKLVYLIDDADTYSQHDYDTNDKLNELLKQVKVPQEVQDKLLCCYREMFNEDLSNHCIQAEVFTHWH